MTPNLGGWIHSFAVTDTQTHKGGYTIYKITSVVFPRSVPQALTCLTIWRRFHDVKRLHRELTRRHKNMKLPGQLPEPTDCSFFKRFDADVIRRRKDYILELLDFAAQHPLLYKCHAFTQFFSEAQQTGINGSGINGASYVKLTSSPSTSPLRSLHSARNLKGGAIAEICDKLDLRYDPHEVNNCIEFLDPDTGTDKSKMGENLIMGVKACDNVITELSCDNSISTDLREKKEKHQKPCKDYTRFLTPMASIESDDSDYIYEAALEFSRAVQAEANLDYKEAHLRYKRGVEVLLVGSKDDSNDERKIIAKAKITKYLARADDIYDKFLWESGSDGGRLCKSKFQLSIDVTDNTSDAGPTVYLERPWNHLAKYKVLKVLGNSVMQVYCVTESEPRATYVMKGIEKPSSNMPTQTIFLPQQVPYMIDLLAFFQSEQKIFLLLKQAMGGRLYDYVQSYSPTVEKMVNNFAVLFPDTNETHAELVEGGSSSSVSVVNEQDSGYIDENNTETRIKLNKNLPPTESTEFSELVRCSQQLLQSVSKTLKDVQDMEDLPISNKASLAEEKVVPSSSHSHSSSPPNVAIIHLTKMPEASLKQWARELAVAIHSLHGKGVILSDLHMENLLLGAKGQLLLTYFYQNEGLDASDNYIHKSYSPKALEGHFVACERPLTCKSDWWSYGVVLYQLLVGLPFKTAHPGYIEMYGFVQYPDNLNISDCARSLLDSLLKQAPEERLDYEQIKAHDFFAGTNWEEVRFKGINDDISDSCKKI